MPKNLDDLGLKSVANSYDVFFIDIWGVLHNGINLYQNSVNVLNELEKLNKNYILLTNAPRPNRTVIEFLKKMGLDENKCSKVYTSGESALKHLEKNYKEKKFYHIGPPRDFDLFKLFEKNKIDNLEQSNFILCTGLFEEYEEDLKYYKEIFKNVIGKIMICTNPDLIVDRGNVTEYCAGSVAKIFEDLGGKVEYFGKPYPPVYRQAADIKNKKILCIGDNLNTDIKGANIQNFDSMFISSGIHKKEIDKNIEELILGCSHYPLIYDFLRKKLDSNIKIIDPSVALVKKFNESFAIPKTACHESLCYENVEFFVTSEKDEFFKKVKFWLEINKEIKLVNLRSNV